MDNNRINPSNSKQFTFSLKLLQLLQWLTDNASDKFIALIKHEFAQGLNQQLADKNMQDADAIEALQHNVIEFFELLEHALDECLAEQARLNAHQQNLQPAIDQIDTSVCNNRLVQSTIEQVVTQIANDPLKNPKAVLYKELLKRWKPHKQELGN